MRADGGPEIGMGHFIRTLALGEMLQEDFYCIYATKNPSNYQRQEIQKVCKELIELPDSKLHFEMLLNHLKGDEIVVLDNYYFDTDYQQKIKNKGCKLVCIDDMHDKHYVADIVINHAEGLNSDDFSIDNNTKLLLGYKYALLRKPFYTTDDVLPKYYDILISIGGADPHDITYTIVKNLLSAFRHEKIAVVVGEAYKGKVRDLHGSRLKLFSMLSASQMCNLMVSSKYGIFPASSVAIEATALRLPFLVGYYVDNQLDIYNGIINKGLGLDLGNLKELNESKLQMNLTMLMYNKAGIADKIKEQQMESMDKIAPKRITNIFQSLS